MTQPAQASAKSQEMLQVMQQAVAEALDKKQRLGQYAVVWKDGAPVKVGGESDDMEVTFLLADKNFHAQQLLTLPESARLTRMTSAARIKSIDERLAQLASAKRSDLHGDH
jgi:hypothetical protein